MINKSFYSSSSELWETPQFLFDDLHKEFNFTLDACALLCNAKCKDYFSPMQDGLSQSWKTTGAVWVNPPYGKKITLWVKKAYEESKKGQTVVMLLPVRTDTLYFHNYIYNNAEIRFIKGRLHFNNSKNAAPFPSMIVIFRGE